MEIVVKQEKKQTKHLFKPGVSGNPHGRPKLEHTFAETARKMMSARKVDVTYVTVEDDGQEKTKHIKIETDQKSIYHGLVAALIKDGMRGNTSSITQLIDRTEGKALQPIETKQDINITGRFDDLSDDELDQAIQARTVVAITGEGTTSLPE